MMKNSKVTMLAAVLVGIPASLSQAQVLYSEDFSSAVVVNSTIDNGNTNYAAMGVAAEMNQNEWFTRGTKGSVTHDDNDYGHRNFLLYSLLQLEHWTVCCLHSPFRQFKNPIL